MGDRVSLMHMQVSSSVDVAIFMVVGMATWTLLTKGVYIDDSRIMIQLWKREPIAVMAVNIIIIIIKYYHYSYYYTIAI